MTKRAIRVALPCALFLANLAVPAQADIVNGTGQAPITKDIETTRNVAMAAARREIVVAMLTGAIGADRLREVPPATIDQIASQIRPDMITGQTAERQGGNFLVTLTADIDGAWFRQQLDNANIDSSSQRADNDRALMLVMLDEQDGVASDFSKPAEVEVDYTHAEGGSFHDHSSEAASSHEADAASSRQASAYSASAAGRYAASSSAAYQGSDAAAYRGVNGAAASSSHAAGAASSSTAGAYASHAAGASMSASAHAHSASAAYAQHTAVDAEVHNDTTYHAHVIYQRPPAGSDGDAIMAALKGSLVDYGVATGDSWQALDAFYHGAPPRYAALKQDASYNAFLTGLGTRNTPFFLGGTFAVTHGGTDPATGQARCSASLDATASATADGRTISAKLVTQDAIGSSPEACAKKVAAALAQAAATAMGPQIQNYWRRQARAAVGQNTQQVADYTLVVHGTALGLAQQADILDALQTTPGVESENFVSQTPTDLRFTVRYAGNAPLQMALYMKLRSQPAYAGMTANADGRSILMCISACGASH